MKTLNTDKKTRSSGLSIAAILGLMAALGMTLHHKLQGAEKAAPEPTVAAPAQSESAAKPQLFRQRPASKTAQPTPARLPAPATLQSVPQTGAELDDPFAVPSQIPTDNLSRELRATSPATPAVAPRALPAQTPENPLEAPQALPVQAAEADPFASGGLFLPAQQQEAAPAQVQQAVPVMTEEGNARVLAVPGFEVRQVSGEFPAGQPATAEPSAFPEDLFADEKPSQTSGVRSLEQSAAVPAKRKPQLSLEPETEDPFGADLAIPAAQEPEPSFEPAPFTEVESAPIPSLPAAGTPVPQFSASDLQPASSSFEPAIAEPQALAAASDERLYEVQPGDNYWTISRHCYGTARYFSAIAEYNKHRIPKPEQMKPGMIVLIPDTKMLNDRYPKLTGAAEEEAARIIREQHYGFFVDSSGVPLYRVGEGDVLTDIAEKHLGRSSRWVQIYGMNRERISNPDALKIGTVLRLPNDASQVSLAPSSSTSR